MKYNKISYQYQILTHNKYYKHLNLLYTLIIYSFKSKSSLIYNSDCIIVHDCVHDSFYRTF